MLWTAEIRTAETHYPLEVLYCDDCAHGQLSVVVDPEVVFPEDYPYQSGNSPALHREFEALAHVAGELVDLNAGALVVDIGANDGTLLSKFDGCRTVGVEPTRQAEKIDGEAYQAFFDLPVAEDIVRYHGKASVVTACNVLAHVPDLDEMMGGIRALLADDGILIAENHDLEVLVNGCQWDTVYHEHLRFFTQASFSSLLVQHGLQVMQATLIDTHGGSFRMVADLQDGGFNSFTQPLLDFEELQDAARRTRRAVRRMQPMPGIGATARATTIINYCGLDVDDIPYVCEVAGSDKIGRYVPGTRIPVVDEARLFDENPRGALLFSWHMADRIAPKLRERGFTGNLLAPLPTLRHV
jgi:hypothetical protein